MNTYLDRITKQCLPDCHVSWKLCKDATVAFLALENAQTIERISELFTSLNIQLDDKITITTGKDKQIPFWPTIILQNITVEKLILIEKSLATEKLIKGPYVSDHACTIPHRIPRQTEVGRTNRNALYVKLNDERIIEVPENIHHYINPNTHKNYGSFMPNVDFIEWALTPSLAFIDYTSLPEKTAVPAYGYISYVRKNGYLDSGISDTLGYRQGNRFFLPQYRTQIVMTSRTDSNVMEKAEVQRTEYKDLCQAVSSRFEFQILLFNPLLIVKLKSAAHQYDQEKLNHLGIQIKDYLSSGGEISTLFNECAKYFQREPRDYNALNFTIGSKLIKLSRSESAIVYAMLTSRYFEPFTLDMKTLNVTFSEPSEMVLSQFAAYRDECASSLGYQSPLFERTPVKEESEPGHDSDDELAARDEGCSLM